MGYLEVEFPVKSVISGPPVLSWNKINWTYLVFNYIIPLIAVLVFIFYIKNLINARKHVQKIGTVAPIKTAGVQGDMGGDMVDYLGD